MVIPGIGDKRYVVVENDGYALLIYPDSLIWPFVYPDISMGVFSLHTQYFPPVAAW